MCCTYMGVMSSFMSWVDLDISIFIIGLHRTGTNPFWCLIPLRNIKNLQHRKTLQNGPILRSTMNPSPYWYFIENKWLVLAPKDIFIPYVFVNRLKTLGARTNRCRLEKPCEDILRKKYTIKKSYEVWFWSIR